VRVTCTIRHGLDPKPGRIFDALYTTNPGHGMGCHHRTIVENHGAVIGRRPGRSGATSSSRSGVR